MLHQATKEADEHFITRQQRSISENPDSKYAAEYTNNMAKWLLVAHGATAIACFSAATSNTGWLSASALATALAIAAIGMTIVGVSIWFRRRALHSSAYLQSDPIQRATKASAIQWRQFHEAFVDHSQKSERLGFWMAESLMVLSFVVLIGNILIGAWQLSRGVQTEPYPFYEVQFSHTDTPYLPTSLPQAAQPGRVLRANSSIYGPS